MRREPHARCPQFLSHRHRGQSLIVALIVMFALLFIGGIFVGLVARNLLNTGRTSDTLSAAAFAEAGLKYVDYNLQYSPEGADWRPEPTPPLGPNDPDKIWLDQGFSRIDLGKGRALVRVSYKQAVPNPSDPPLARTLFGDPNLKLLSGTDHFLLIESVGRVGTVNPNDPTTFLNQPAPRLRRALVAYKAIGLTDYLLFVTNLFKEEKFQAFLGVPPLSVPVAMQLGGLPVRTFGNNPFPSIGAPIKVNGNLQLAGNLVLVAEPRLGQTIQVAGNIQVDTKDGEPRFVNPVSLPNGAPILPSTDPNYTTFGGLLRDGAATPDLQGYTRAIPYLPPPRIDEQDPATRSTRAHRLTRDSGVVLSDGRGGNFNTGRFGLGSGLYIDNFGNFERETQRIGGGQSLRSIWLQPGESTPYWNGPYYIPPGVYIEFGYPVVQDRTRNGDLIPGQYVPRPGFRIIRDPSDRPFRDPSGRIAPTEMDYTYFIYKAAGQRPVLKLDNEFFRAYLRNTLNMTEQQIDAFLPEFNGVIYAEGNVRVRGLLPGKANIPIRGATDMPDAQIREAVNAPAVNVMSGATIYIEGSLVRESAESMIGLLAKEYVTINTTMFLTPGGTNLDFHGSQQDELPPFHLNVSTGSRFTLDFLFGEDPTQYTSASGSGAVGLNLLIRHGTAPGLCYLNLFVNEGTEGASPLYRFNQNAPPFTDTNPPQEVYTLANFTPQADLFEQRAFPLLPKPNNSDYNLFTAPGVRNTLRFAVDTNFISGSGTQDYLFSRAAIVPMDVRIEAVIYAQNGSFFIIPGYPLNTNPADTRDAALRRAQAANLPPGTMLRPAGTADIFPFYNEPIDCRITIVGAIAQNRTASIADQAAWMQLWGYIPEVMGSTGNTPNSTTEMRIPQEHINVGEVGLNPIDHRTQAERNARITRGLRLLYDPALIAPFQGYDPTNAHPFRHDDHGRVLPPIPRLPVCPGFVFSGEIR
jgi:hypothetical protein